MNRTKIKRNIYVMKEMVNGGVEGCDGDDEGWEELGGLN